MGVMGGQYWALENTMFIGGVTVDGKMKFLPEALMWDFAHLSRRISGR
jgi:uncharacterized membrane protein